MKIIEEKGSMKKTKTRQETIVTVLLGRETCWSHCFKRTAKEKERKHKMFSLFFQERFADDITHNKELEKEKNCWKQDYFPKRKSTLFLKTRILNMTILMRTTNQTISLRRKLSRNGWLFWTSDEFKNFWGNSADKTIRCRFLFSQSPNVHTFRRIENPSLWRGIRHGYNQRFLLFPKSTDPAAVR